MKITLETTLHLHDIQIRKDNKNYIVEDTKTQEFYEMPMVCIDAIELINEGCSVGEIEQKLIEKYPNEDIDVIDFVDQLLDIDLIKAINGEELKQKGRNPSKLGFEWISPTIGKVFFNKYTNYLYGALFVISISIFIINPSLFPYYRDLFIFDIMSLNILIYGILSLVLVLVHELGHILAIRSFNLPTKLEIGHRLFLVVFETDMTLAWKLPQKKRNILYLAGICFDSVILFIALLTKLIIPLPSEIISGIIGLIIFDIVVRTIYQCCIYMKTDFYFLFQNLTGCYNLMENGNQFLKNLFSKNNVKSIDLFKGEHSVVRFFSIFYVIGVGITLCLFSIFYIPQLIYMGVKVLPGLTRTMDSPLFWDAIIYSFQMFLLIGLFVFSIGKTRRRKMSKFEN
ncbi:PqqD family protein [Fredinandcohnia quinoae]|uniref:Uncharacterized protein n=1 Tax=Fredinandcohnia quinoae TaxID=2918902 RepID=A0AAW5DW77_9BACI|nr:PqqD family protein [Fredinandcohnia sp. SECRCQ15]MCH1624268.1 hypothetical protein [Fredinandcohnia sp. SECRCQ15]